MKHISFALLSTIALHTALCSAEDKGRFQVTTNHNNTTTISITDHDKKIIRAASLGAGAGFFSGVITADAIKQACLPKALFALAFVASLNSVGKNLITQSLGHEYLKVAGGTEAAVGLLTLFALTSQ